MKITQHPIGNNRLEPFGDYHLSLLLCAMWTYIILIIIQLLLLNCLKLFAQAMCFFLADPNLGAFAGKTLQSSFETTPYPCHEPRTVSHASQWGLPLFPSLRVTLLPWSGQLTWTWVKVIDSGSHALQARPMRVFLEIFLRPLRRKCLLFSKISRLKDSISFKLPAVISSINQGKSVWKWSPQRRKRDQHTLFWEGARAPRSNYAWSLLNSFELRRYGLS